MNIIVALIILSIIVIIHEFGHFLLAKANGIGVTEFAVGMGPRICQFTKGETVYCIKLLPFGGSCMMVGEDENSDDERAFNNKPVWARISVIAAGPVFNFLLALIMAFVIIGNIGYDPCVIYKVSEGSVAYKAGLREGDLIQSINGKRVVFGREYSLIETAYPDKTLEIMYLRDGVENTVTIEPEFVEGYYYQVGISISELTVYTVADGKPADNAGLKKDDIIKSINGENVNSTEDAVYAINNSNGEPIVFGILRGNDELSITVTPELVHTSGYETGITINTVRQKTGAVNTVVLGFHEVKYGIKTVIDSLSMLFRGRVTSDDIAGPVGVVTLIGDVVKESRSDGLFYVFMNIFNLTLMLSANLGVMNLLPLPALDGGRLVFLILEAIRRKPVDREKEGMVHFVGIILLMILMVYVTFNDIIKLF